MEYLYISFYYCIIFLILFGVPLKHLIALLRNEEKLIQKYENPGDYRTLAVIQVFNMVFIFAVFIGFWLMLRGAGSGSFNSIMLLPFLIIYIVSVIVVEKKIDKLPWVKAKRWK